MDSGTTLPFEQYAAQRLTQDREQIALEWTQRLASQLNLTPRQVLPHPALLDDIPLILTKVEEFLLAPDVEKLTTERLITDEMRNISLLRRSQGWAMQEVVREFDELAQILDGAAMRWIDDYPGTPDAKSVGCIFGRLNRVPLLMGQITVGALERERNDLLRQLAAAEEEERIRLSRELHDQLGQLLTALPLGLKSLDRGPPRGPGRSMREPVTRLGGTIEIGSSPGGGTALFARVPDAAAPPAVPEQPPR